MDLKKMLFRNEEVEEVDVFECWEVEWISRHSEYSSGTKPEVRAFPKKEDAEAFKTALDDAYKLIRHTSGTRTVLRKQRI